MSLFHWLLSIEWDEILRYSRVCRSPMWLAESNNINPNTELGVPITHVAGWKQWHQPRYRGFLRPHKPIRSLLAWLECAISADRSFLGSCAPLNGINSPSVCTPKSASRGLWIMDLENSVVAPLLHISPKFWYRKRNLSLMILRGFQEA